MCKFNLKFVLIVCCAQLIQISVTSPLGTLLFDDYADEPSNSDYDLHYDERQNGTENYRFNINGVVIAVPGASGSAMNSIGLLASNYLLELADTAAAANEESESDDDVPDDNSSDDKPYDFEIPTGHDDKIDNSEPVVISADSIIPETKPNAKPDENLLVINQDLKPENHVDAINEKESATNKKDLTDIDNIDLPLNSNIKSKNKVIIKESAVPDKTKVSPLESTRQVSPKVGTKRRNKFKLRIGSLIDYLKRSRE